MHGEGWADLERNAAVGEGGGVENVSTCCICGLGSQCESYVCLYSGVVGPLRPCFMILTLSKKLSKA